MDIQDVFDCESLIDFNVIIQLLEKNKEKEIVCFGAGTAVTILQKKVFCDYPVDYYVDNNRKLWGTKLDGVPVCNPEKILDLPKGTYIVLIISKATIRIGEQLQEYGLIEGKDYVNVYDQFISCFRIKKFADTALDFVNFIKRTPENYFENIVPTENKGKIGICCIASITDWNTWYPIVLYMLLKKRGYDVELIVDSIKGFYDLTLFDEHSKIVRKYIDYVIAVLKDYIPDIKVKYVDEANELPLYEDDYDEIERLTEVNVAWHAAQLDHAYGIPNSNRYILFKQLLTDDMKIIKGFLADNSYDVLCLTTGLHRTFGLYTYLGHQYGARVSSFDGFTNGEDYTFFSTDFACSYFYDIRKIFSCDLLTKYRKEILEYAKKVFDERIHATASSDKASWQTVEENSLDVNYDIVMPLNLPWDAPALGLHRCFSSFGDWILETVRYIYEHTSATLLIREHPCIRDAQDYYNASWKDEVEKIVQGSKRVCYCSWNQDVNTYRCIEHAKLVLPYSSTTGIEAVLLGCEIITHTECYYDALSFSNRAENKREYFQLIEEGLKGNLHKSQEHIDDALIAFLCSMNNGVETAFREQLTQWISSDIVQVDCMQGVDQIVKIIAEDISAEYQNISRLIGIEEDYADC